MSRTVTPDTSLSPCRALVIRMPDQVRGADQSNDDANGSAATHYRPDARFVAHLVATASHAPQTCARRRGTDADAAHAYGGTPRNAARHLLLVA